MIPVKMTGGEETREVKWKRRRQKRRKSNELLKEEGDISHSENRPKVCGPMEEKDEAEENKQLGG